MFKRPIFLLVFVTAFVGVAAMASFVPAKTEEVENYPAPAITRAPEPTHLAFVGDIMFDRDVKKEILNHGGDYNFTFAKIAPTLKTYDFLFGNLEGPVSDLGEKVGSIYSFRMDPETVDALKSANFSAVSIANNHIGDWGIDALKDTASRLMAAQITPVGFGENATDAYTPKIITVKNLKIAFIGASEFGRGFPEAQSERAGIAIINRDKLVAEVKQARQEADLVVVSLHFGVEYQPEPNEYQKDIARALVDAGADLVAGHHPHVLEPLEAYKDGYIIYSLGNFVFDQKFSKATMTSGILEVEVSDKKITNVLLRKVFINNDLQPTLADSI